MTRKLLAILFSTVFFPVSASIGIEQEQADVFFGEDLHLQCASAVRTSNAGGECRLVCDGGFSLLFGGVRFVSDRSAIVLEKDRIDSAVKGSNFYKAKVYLKGDIEAVCLRGKKKGIKASRLGFYGIEAKEIEAAQRIVLWFDVSGEVFLNTKQAADREVEGLELYQEATEAFEQIPAGPRFVVQQGAIVPQIRQYAAEVTEKAGPKIPADRPEQTAQRSGKVVEPETSKAPAVVEADEPAQAVELGERTRQVSKAGQAGEQPRILYPVNIAPLGTAEPKIESARLADGSSIATVIGRFYMWQRQDETGRLLELQADNAVIYYGSAGEASGKNSILPSGDIRAVYLCGDVVMRQGKRVVRAEQMYYDFVQKKALAIGAVMQNFDANRGIPIYVRAAKLRQLAENRFSAENIILTSSEFYRPQLSLSASKVNITDTTVVDEQTGQLTDSSWDAQLYDVRMKVDDTTIFYWPYLRSNLERPDVPIKSARFSRDSTWGTTLETRWYFARLLGLRQPPGTDSTLALDYFEKRGIGAGGEITYSRGNYFGHALGYIINDTGKDDLGRYYTRRNVEPPDNLRGRFSWYHRHFLPFNWQVTTGIGYASDENFIEGYYRGEYNVGMNESYMHMKRLEDNWALSILTKGRINDFSDELEELPSAEFHLTGESVFDDRLTFYSDTEISRLRQRIGDKHGTVMDENMFAFVSHRSEVDMPFRAAGLKFVPFAAGSFGYDDRSGFTRSLVDGSNTGSFGEDKIWFGELGLRLFGPGFWKLYPQVQSRLWDLNGLRHIIKPYAVGVAYKENDSVIKQRDTASVGISQRLQTKRGPAGNERIVDWMQLDTDIVWVNDSVSATDAGPGPDRFIWSRPIVPLRVFSAPGIFSGDLIDSLHRFDYYGPRRNYFSADYIWRISDTSAFMSDMNFDIQDGVVQQFNAGLSRLRWPNLSYYIGSRYLRRLSVLDEKGSNALTFSATYKIDPRYTAVFSQQYDFDYEANIRSDITLIRKYHRIFISLTYSTDESLKRQAIVFSIWPEGIREFAFGQRRYMRLGGAAGY